MRYPITHMGSFDSLSPVEDQRTMVEMQPGGWSFEHDEMPRPVDYNYPVDAQHGDMSGFWDDITSPSLLDIVTGSVFTSAVLKNPEEVLPVVAGAGAGLSIPSLGVPAYRTSELLLGGGSPQVSTTPTPKSATVASQTGSGMYGKTSAVPTGIQPTVPFSLPSGDETILGLPPLAFYAAAGVVGLLGVRYVMKKRAKRGRK